MFSSDSRAFSSSVQLGDPLEWSKVPSICEYPIQSYICVPSSGKKIKRDEEAVDVAGYAWSGGGRGIIRVEISTDGGKTWQLAELEQDPDQDLVCGFSFVNSYLLSFLGTHVGMDFVEGDR